MSGRTFNVGVPVAEYVGTDEQAQDILVLFLKKVIEDPGDLIGFDTETTGKKMPFKIGNKHPLDWMSDTITFWSLAMKYRGEYRRFCLRGEHFQGFAPLLENPNAWFACWNAKYDAHVSWNSGINIWNANIVDGLALAGLHDENKIPRGLKVCAKSWAGLAMTRFTDLFPNRDVNGKKIKEFETSLYDLPIGPVSDYASYDAYCHLKTVEWVRHRLQQTPIEEGYSLWDYFLGMEMKMTEVLWRMERRGMPINIEFLQSKIPVIDKELVAIEGEINRIAGRPINFGSTQQLAKFFFGRKDDKGLGLKPVKMTAGNKPSVDEEVMNLLAEAGIEMALKIVRHRSLYKTKGTYLKTLINLALYYEDHRIHPNFNQFGAKTGRFSTDAPNSQNMPRADTDEFEIRKAFCAPPGHKLIIADYEQLEMRIMAHMSGDKAMIKAIKEGKDLHSFTVSRMVPNVTYDEVVAAVKVVKKYKGAQAKLAEGVADALDGVAVPTERMYWLNECRQDNKAVGFGIIYGAGPPKISSSIQIPEKEIQARIERLMEDERRATPQQVSKGHTFTGRIEKMMKRNPLLTRDASIVQIARQSIASDKIRAYFDTFPGVEYFMERMKKECLESLEYRADGTPKGRPTDRNNIPVQDGKEYDWDIAVWDSGANELTRTGHEKRFGFVKTLCGRYRRLPDICHSNYRFKSEAERQAINTPIQGSAADITKGAMLRIEEHPILNRLEVALLNQVHDEIILQVPEENADEALPLILECMEHPFVEGEAPLMVPIPADGKVVSTWAEK